ncbi:MAG: DNA repair protein RecO C-terminal domain-containing protein [Clostridiales bacterium]|nr:DNA repair protein RecO C-terminal domain-containing protein [Clostridiales bacterium]
MFQHLDCIALRLVRHTDRHSILSAYTRQRGRLSFLVSAGNGREAARRRAMLMPGSRFQCVADIKDTDRLPLMREVLLRGNTAPGGDAVKSAVTLFLADFLNTLLRDSMPDALMFDFCDNMLDFYSRSSYGNGSANFHLLFMIKMMHFAGIEPDVSTWSKGSLFDMVDGIYRTSAPMHGRYLERNEAQLSRLLLRMNLRNLRYWKFSAVERNAILDRLMEYYSLHFASLQSMKSLDVLRSLF